MSVPKSKKPKPKYNADFKAGREKGVADTLCIFFALLMQDEGWTLEKVEKFGKRVLDVEGYANEPNLPFYVSTVEKILKEQGLHIVR